ncbi:MAG: glycosyltransferase [Candidatus Hydrogenedentes bacterium]|nr:glycosyltransferase [Candidatus Hydrogenedentota bacterium]
MPILTVVMIMRDEADWLPACLESVRAIADNIVIGDTGSTDTSIAIAQRYGVKVVPVPWTNDFAAARNSVLAEAHGDWLLHMDADENLELHGAATIRALIDDDGRGADAIEVTLGNYCDDVRAWRWVACATDDPNARGRTGYIAVPLLRLFRNHCGYHYREPVHENITESVMESGGVIGQAHDILIHHHGFGKGGPEKAARYLDIARQKVALRPDDAKAWHDLAEQLVSMDRAGQAREAAQRALQCDAHHIAAATTLANIMLNNGELDPARKFLEPFAETPNAPPHVLIALCAIACKEGRIEDARLLSDRAIGIAPNNVLARLTAARACDLLGNFQDSRAHLDRARKIAPAVEEIIVRCEAHQLRAEAKPLLTENPKRALATLVAALKLDPEDPLIHAHIAEVLEALGDPIRACQSRERAFALAPRFQ